jgi:hypothetical protein
VPPSRGYLPAWLLAEDRMDVWVLKVSIAILLVCIAGLGLWHLVAYLTRKLPKKRRSVRQSPEPPSATQSLKLPPHTSALGEVLQAADDPETVQQVCTALEDSLADAYLELAESWLRRGEPRKAVAVLEKILQICPARRQAELARQRLQQIGGQGEGQ